MDHFTVTRSIDIHYAHRVPLHDGKCAGLHGHRGTVEVELCGGLSASGANTDMVVDFSRIEQAMEDQIKGLFCHRTILWQGDPLVALLTHGTPVQYSFPLAKEDDRVVVVVTEYGTYVLLPFIPTAERLAQACFRLMQRRLNVPGISVQRVRFWETAKSVATYPARTV